MKDSTVIQSYLFDKTKWTPESVDNWLKNHLSDKPITAELITAPYKNLIDLPPAVKRKLDIEGQRKFMAVFNGAWDYYNKKFDDKKKVETMAFKTAWSKSRGNGIVAKLTNLFKAKQEESIEDMDKIQQADAEILNSVLLEKKSVIMEKQNQLLDKLLKERKNEDIS